ncbi:hypothetical protein B0T22DRAFT_368497 [Podospora appendiculata]|uniref:sn-1-specific diacylglycerol lipase n=1 Tax=Podospora appendiculata TaxID=314037 RepID=A0AAE1CIC2_9PEZI|nr:hypothetical protein B0T22DRAFT_368497 [Podospora appendiculata]
MDTHSTRLAIASGEHHSITSQLHDLAPSSPGRTLLPSPAANCVSFVTRSTGLVLRLGSVVSSYGFDAAKVTTLSSLELGRSVLESILGRAGRDVLTRSGSDSSRADAETVLERSIENLHRTMTQLVFWTTTGFHLTGTAAAVISEGSQLLLSTLDQFFGSTDSSRAMAGIITLIRREFQNPATGVQGEKVGVVDLLLGLCGMAYLQRWCRRLLEEERRTLRVEEIVWDVVVLSDGMRVDVHEESLYGIHDGKYGGDGSLGEDHHILSNDQNDQIIATIEGHGARDSDSDQTELPESELRRQIMRTLPENAKVSITTETNITKTITLDITGSTGNLLFSPPPGVELIEESRRALQPSTQALIEQGMLPDNTPPTYHVVYRLKRTKERRTSFKKEDGDISQVAGYVEQVRDHSDAESSASAANDTPPSVPPKTPISKVQAPETRPGSVASVSSTSTSHSRPSRASSLPKPISENTANQKRPRMPLAQSAASSSNSQPTPIPRRQTFNRVFTSKSKDSFGFGEKQPEKKGGFRNVLKRPGSMFNKEDSGSESALGVLAKRKGKQNSFTQLTGATPGHKAVPPPITTPPSSRLSVPRRGSSLIPQREAPRPPSHSIMGHGTRGGGTSTVEDPYPRSTSRASYISVHERRRDSMVSQTDTYSIAPTDNYRPNSPSGEGSSSVARPRTEKDGTFQFLSPARNTHRRLKSHMHSPSIYTLRTNESLSSLVPAYALYQKSAFNDTEALGTLRRAGMVDGMFPKYHLLRNITRFMRFASASYGSNFLKVLGIAKEMPTLRALDDTTHHELRSFAHHTKSDANSILLSSFVDPQGGSDGTGSTNTGVPLVHYISLDHESKAVVLACRGTLGFEDVLADMTCDYDDLVWRGKAYKVHKGVHASAQRLLYGGDGRVLYTLKQALEEFPDYGLVLTGHSLGGAVTALLGVMLSEPAPGTTSFVTSLEHQHRLLGDGLHATTPPRHVCLPSGRPVHVFAYGPPSTMSASLCTATRGLITSIVNGNDLVPYLSLGVLHDFQAMALAFKTDNNDAKVEVRQRIWDAFQNGLTDKWYGSNETRAKDHDAREDDDQWAYAALKVLRASMMSQKLLPPGEVFTVETTKVLRRDAFLREGERHLGRPAERIVLKYVRDVEQRFREVRFGTSMLTDHSPGKYEDALNKLKVGVMETADR